MDEDRSSEPEKAGDQHQGQVLPPRGGKPDGKQSDIAPAAETNESQYLKRTLKERWREFGAVDADRHVELILAMAISFFACCQLLITCSNNKSTGQQMSNLLSAANSIQASANSFSQSASHINNGIDDAVGKLGDQAQQMEDTRKSSEGEAKNALQSTIDDFHRDQRAWVGLSAISGVPTLGEIFTISPAYVNTGKTPALDLRYQSREILLGPDQPFTPDWNATREPRTREPSQSILFPNQQVMQHIRVSRDPNTDEDVPIKQADLDFINNRTKIIYVFGRACYKDVFGVDHFLHYCSFYDPGSKAYFACAKYNDIDDGQNGKSENCPLPK